MGLEQRHQLGLALLHQRQGAIEPGGLGRPGHGGGKQHARADRPAEQQQVARLERPLRPKVLGRHRAIHREGQGQAGPIAALQGVAADQACPQRIEHGAHPRQALKKQVLLQPGPGLRHGHQGLDAGHPGATGPKVTAGVQGGEPGVQPGVVHQGRKAIDALEQQRPVGGGGHQGGVFGLGGLAPGGRGQACGRP